MESIINLANLKRPISDDEEEDGEVGSKMICNYMKLGDSFFNNSCEALAKSLLGKILARKISDEVIVKGRIVETECYLGGQDKASHSYNGRRTNRNEPMYMKPGTAYVYMTFGMYYCFNISSNGDGAAVLLRALEPVTGLEYMIEKRGERKSKLKLNQLCNGPSKLCTSLNITKNLCNKLDLCNNDELWIEDDDYDEDINIVTSARVGIESAGEEWANKPLRFYILGNPAVSKRDKTVESMISNKI